MIAPDHEPSARMRVNRKKSVISFYERQFLQGSRDPVRSLVDLGTHNHTIDHERPLWVVGTLSYRHTLYQISYFANQREGDMPGFAKAMARQPSRTSGLPGRSSPLLRVNRAVCGLKKLVGDQGLE